MEEVLNDKIVRYDLYCNKCVNKDLKDYEDPCNECLNEPVNKGSIKPNKFKERDKNA